VGLTVARGFVSLHGGTIEARSGGLGAGAEFVVRLPAEAGPARRAVAISEGPKRGIRILVAEDDRDVAESMELLLRAYGHRVQLVVDGPSALEAARAEAPTLMIVDIGLPGMDGYEVARGVRQSLGLRDTVLIALTGYGQEQDRRRAREAGFDHHLTKPVDPSVLRSLIADIPSRPSDR
jgi:CheY-like chemotaxis protein